MKKATNKLMSFLAAFAMVIGVLVAPFANANADEDTTPEKTTKVTLHKLLMTKTDLVDWDEKGPEGYDGTQNTQQLGELQSVNKTLKEIPNVFFAVQNSEGKYLAKDGTVATVQDPTAKGFKEAVLGGLTTEKGLELNTSNLEQDKATEYTIVEIHELSEYKGDDGEQLAASKAVPVKITLPLYNNDGLVTAAHVYPKNTQEAPKIDKNFDNEDNNDATAISTDDLINNDKTDNNEREKGLVTKNIGDKVPYKVVTEIPQDARYKKLIWTDQMTKGLTYNKDLKVTLGDTELESADYTVINTDRGFTLKLTDAGLTKVENAAKTSAQTIILKYTATVNENVEVDKADENDVALDYSNKPGKESEPKEGNPVNKEIKVKKDWAIDGDEITEADKTVKALFTLQEKQEDGSWKDVDSYEATIADHFEHTFKDLDDEKTYRVVEQVSGYEPEYVSFNNGVVEIKNDKDSTNPKTLNPSEPKVVTGGRKFVKTNNEDKTSDKLERLAGAEFYVKNAEGKYLVAAKKDTEAVKKAKEELDAAVKAYNELSAEDQKGDAGTKAKATIDEKQDTYNEKFVENATDYTWGDKEDDNVVTLTSDSEGRFEIKGLAYAKDYALEEKEAPSGYAKLQSDEKFDVEEGSYASTDAELQYNKDNADDGYGLQIKNKNVTIPETGGIGSLIFIVAGLALMGVAFTAMKRRNSYEEA